MTALPPPELDYLLAEIRMLTRSISHEYRWVHGAAHARTVGEEAKVATTSPSDPTGSIAVDSRDKGRMRAQLYRTIEDARRALAELEHASASLRAGAARDPGGVRFEALRYPRTALQEELKDSRAAKVRREERGEGWGEG